PSDQAYALAAYQLPQGEVETALAQIWAELLGVSTWGFFERITEEFGARVCFGSLWNLAR
ncbi:hypothetical protein IQ16_08661, partial [Bradyrhizobium huanghuaihaiense]